MIALIALGANLDGPTGTPAQSVAAAMRSVRDMAAGDPADSALYRTPAHPAGSGPDFVNAAMRIETDLPPDALIRALHAIEDVHARQRPERWGPRSLDIDLIAVGDRVLPDAATQARWMALPPERHRSVTPDTLILPHPRLQERAFVLVPLCDVAPDWRHPVLGRTARQLCDALGADARAQVVALDVV